MKLKFKFFFIASLTLALNIKAQTKNKNYDSTLAKSLKADARGMKMYVLVMLKTGSVPTLPKTRQDSIFAGHMKNIGRMADEGKLVVAGPFEKNDLTYRGLYIFDTESLEEAKKWVETDPAVASKLLAADYLEWYGSAAMMEVNKIHKKIQKETF